MIFIRRVSGKSMLPALKEGAYVVCRTKKLYRAGDVVVANINDREVVKRIAKIKNDTYYLLGDNASLSTDSREYGFLAKEAIIGGIMIKFPTSEPAPALRHSFGVTAGRITATILILFALIHLFRIDTFVPALESALGWSSFLAALTAVIIILTEVLALPFLMRMRLSPLFRYISGILSVFAPLIWVLITIWCFGLSVSTGQLGGTTHVEANWPVLLLNIVWLMAAYWTLWALGYEDPKRAKSVPKQKKPAALSSVKLSKKK